MTVHFKTQPKSSPRKNKTPLVEAITKYPGEWEVLSSKESGIAFTDNATHLMVIPTDDLPCRCGVIHDDAVRLHESLHSKLSPLKPKAETYLLGKKKIPIPEQVVVIAEEYRIGVASFAIEGSAKNYICKTGIRNAVYSYLDKGQYIDILHLGLSYGPRSSFFINKAIKSYITNKKASLRKADASKEVQVTILKRLKFITQFQEDYIDYTYYNAQSIMAIHTPIGKEFPSWDSTIALAAWLNELDKSISNKILSDLKIPPDFEELFTESDSTKPLLPMKSPKGFTIPEGERSTGELKWGIPELTTAPLTQSLPPWKLQRHNRAVDEGTIPRYMYRWPIDKRVFHRTKRLAGGSILIDDSGSMNFSTTQLNELLDAAPASVVAVYAGQDNGSLGEIRIVAQDMKKTTKSYLNVHYGGNGIDLPALEWLADQLEPRLWISDGGVSCWSHGFDRRALVQCMEFCKKNAINIISDPEKAIQALTGKLTLAR